MVCEWPRGSLAREFAERGTPGSRAGRPSPVYESAGLLPRLVEAAAVAATALWRQNPDLCRIVLREHDVPGGVNIGLIEQTVRCALDHRYDVVLDGILCAGHYGAMLERLTSEHSGATYHYYFDIPFDVTVERHAERAQRCEFSAEQMREWYSPGDLLGLDGERVIDRTST
ncbi:MAG TPA: kinase [Kribbellaceae bacterium]